MVWQAFNFIAQATQTVANPIRRVTTAAGAASTNQPSAAAPLDTGKVFVALLAVLALILLSRWALRKLAPGALARNSRGIRVVARTYLSPKQQVLILQVGQRLLVVGDSNQHLSTLCEITDPDEAAALLGQLNVSGTEIGETLKKRDEQPAQLDPTLTHTRTELNGLAERVRMLARHLSKA